MSSCASDYKLLSYNGDDRVSEEGFDIVKTPKFKIQTYAQAYSVLHNNFGESAKREEAMETWQSIAASLQESITKLPSNGHQEDDEASPDKVKPKKQPP